MYGMFTYFWLFLMIKYGKCRKLYHAWMLWVTPKCHFPSKIGFFWWLEFSSTPKSLRKHGIGGGMSRGGWGTGVIRWHQPKQWQYQGKIPQSYHTFAVFHSRNVGIRGKYRCWKIILHQFWCIPRFHRVIYIYIYVYRNIRMSAPATVILRCTWEKTHIPRTVEVQ